MITLITGQGIDQTNILSGEFTSSNSEKKLAFLDVTLGLPEHQEKYNLFIDLIGLKNTVEIINTSEDLQFSSNHITPNLVDKEIVQIDFSTLSESDKQIIIDAFEILHILDANNMLIPQSVLNPPQED